jgi:hypothetical protein
MPAEEGACRLPRFVRAFSLNQPLLFAALGCTPKKACQAHFSVSLAACAPTISFTPSVSSARHDSSTDAEKAASVLYSCRSKSAMLACSALGCVRGNVGGSTTDISNSASCAQMGGSDQAAPQPSWQLDKSAQHSTARMPHAVHRHLVRALHVQRERLRAADDVARDDGDCAKLAHGPLQCHGHVVNHKLSNRWGQKVQQPELCLRGAGRGGSSPRSSG